MLVVMVVFGIVLFLIMVWCFMVKPNLSRRESTFALCEIFYAHRGLHDNESSAPENSLFAFKLAVEYGMGVEMDVRRTADNEIVVAHDDNLKRLCGVDKNVSELTYKELKQYKLFDSDETIPLFSEVLEVLDGKVPAVIEIKDEKNIKFLCQKVDNQLKDYKGTYCVESFNPLALRWYKKNRPDIIRGQLSAKFSKKDIKTGAFFLTNLMLNFVGRPDFIAYDQHNRRNLSFRMLKKFYDIPYFAWTVTSQEMLNKLDADIFDAFIFEGFLPDKKKI